MTKRKQHGFTLLELMITVAIVGILAGVAYPAYQSQVRSTRRADAQAELMRMANDMERFFTENGRYDQDLSGTAVPNPQSTNTNTVYTYTLAALGQTSYTLRATPTAGGPQVGDGYLELLDTGGKRWDKNNDADTSDTGENNWDK